MELLCDRSTEHLAILIHILHIDGGEGAKSDPSARLGLFAAD